MKMKRTKSIPALLLALVLVAGLMPVMPASAAGDIYVNSSTGMLSGPLSSAYAVGSGGTGVVSGTYVMTADGLVTIDGSGSATGSTVRPGRDEVSPTPSHLSVTGSITLEYSKVKVGLYFDTGSRDTSLDHANLLNAVGSGYRFGYYDSSRSFVEVGYTNETAITMVMDTNTAIDSGYVVGCYHILLNGEYYSFAEASAAASMYQDGFAAYYNGVYRVLVGQYESQKLAEVDMNYRGLAGTAYSASNRCVVVVRSSDGKILFEFDCGSEYDLAVSPQSSGSKAVTWFKNQKYYGDFIYRRNGGEQLTVINVVNIEDYVKGVIPYEMSASWPVEALKAQALCARTYVASHFGSYSSYGFDVTNDTYCQVYRGTLGANANSDAAVDATAGQYILYNGSPISAMYCSSNGGATENSENVTGSAVGYLRGKVDSFEAAAASINGHSSWEYTLSRSEIAQKANVKGFSVGAVQDIEITYSATGNVIGMKLTDANGRTATFSGSSCYSFCVSSLGLDSISFEITENADSITFTGSGWGHSLGMSQFGAYAMANTYGFTYDQIVNFYYTGITLAQGSYVN